MRPLAVDLVLLRDAAPDLPIVVGRTLAARVVERGERFGILNLAGAYVTAELPDEIQQGDRLRLVVRETTAERVVLALAGTPPAPPEVPPAAVDVPVRGGGRVAVLARDGSGAADDGERAHVVTLRYEGASIGVVELRIALDESLVHARAALADGPPLERARAGANALCAALAKAAGRVAEVDVVARPDPLDVYA